MNFKEIKKKIVPNLLFLTLLTSSTIFFLLIFHFLRPNYDMLDSSYEEKMVQSYEEKMELVEREDEPNLYEVLIFINDTAEENSSVLFFDYTYWTYGLSFLYPYIKCNLTEYSNDEDLFGYLEDNHIDYIIIIEEPDHLDSYTNLFNKIEFDNSIYLLEVEQSEL